MYYVESTMSATMDTLKVGVYQFGGRVPKCAMSLTQLVSNPHCPDISASWDLMGKALAMARIPYQLVPMYEYQGDFGVLNEETGQWSGM